MSGRQATASSPSSTASSLSSAASATVNHRYAGEMTMVDAYPDPKSGKMPFPRTSHSSVIIRVPNEERYDFTIGLTNQVVGQVTTGASDGTTFVTTAAAVAAAATAGSAQQPSSGSAATAGLDSPNLHRSSTAAAASSSSASAASASSTYLYRKKMLVFGGFYENVYHNDLWELDLTSMAWREIKPGTQTISGSSAVVPSHRRTTQSISSSSSFSRVKTGRGKKRTLGMAALLDEELGDFDDGFGDEYGSQDAPSDDDNSSMDGSIDADDFDEDMSQSTATGAAAEADDAATTDLAKDVKWPAPRAAHCAVVRPTVDGGDRLILFGGQNGKESHLNDLWEYNYEKNEWREIKPRGERPPGRSFHSMIYRRGNDSIVVYSGQDKREGVLTDMYEFNFQTRRWTKLTQANESEVQQCEHAFSLGTRMIILESFEEVKVCAYDFDGSKWLPLRPGNPGVLPYRYHFISEMIGRHLAIFGGKSDGDSFFPELFVFDIAHQTWHQVEILNKDMQHQLKRAFCTAVALDDRNLLVFAGKYNNQKRVNDLIKITFSENMQTDVLAAPPPEAFQRQLMRLRSSSASNPQGDMFMSDVTLISNDGRRFSAHKLILALNVPLFRTMFNGSFREAIDRDCHIDEIDGETLQIILDHIYGKEVDLQGNLVTKLIKIASAAHLLMYTPLVKLCMQKMVALLDDDNVLELFKFSLDMGDAGKSLNMKCMQRFSREQMYSIMQMLNQQSQETREPFKVSEISKARAATVASTATGSGSGSAGSTPVGGIVSDEVFDDTETGSAAAAASSTTTEGQTDSQGSQAPTRGRKTGEPVEPNAKRQRRM